MEELYEITYGKTADILLIPVTTLGELPAGRVFKIPSSFKIKDYKSTDVSFRVVQTSQPKQLNNKLITRVNVEVIRDRKADKETCYVCATDLSDFYMKDMKNQDGLNSPPQIPQMIKWNGVREPVCTDCYKACITGLQVYRDNNPNWISPK